MKKIFILLTGLFAAFATLAQNENEALRYSFLMNNGTSRFSALGGAFSSLGGDISSLSTNPAGIGVYKSSDFMFTPKLSFAKATSTFNETSSTDSRASFSIANFGFVLAKSLRSADDKTNGWKNIQYAFGFNNLANFNNQYLISGNNNTSSLLDVYCGLANGFAPKDLNGFDTEMAWNTYLINMDTTGVNKYIPAFRGNVFQQKSIETRGGINEMLFSFGGNYSDRFYLGGTIGFSILNYKENVSYKESDKADTLDYFNSLLLNQRLETYGSGINFKLGFIYRIQDWVRISGAVHTPTSYFMDDKFSSVLKSDLDTAKYESASPKGTYSYKLTTPMRLIGGIAFVIKKHGLISAEYEMVDYTQASFRSKAFKDDFFTTNENIRNNYKVGNNLRIGAEATLSPFVIRGGFSYYGSPYKDEFSRDYSVKNISAGFGIREGGFYIDFAYIHTMKNESFDLYDANVIAEQGKFLPPALTDSHRNSFLVTIGTRF